MGVTLFTENGKGSPTSSKNFPKFEKANPPPPSHPPINTSLNEFINMGISAFIKTFLNAFIYLVLINRLLLCMLF